MTARRRPRFRRRRGREAVQAAEIRGGFSYGQSGSDWRVVFEAADAGGGTACGELSFHKIHVGRDV